MRILYFADAPSIHTQRWVRYFADHGCDVAVVSKRSGSLDGVTVHSVGHIWNPRRLYTIYSLIRDFQPDILHAHYITSFGFWGALSGFHPLILTAWGSDILVTPGKNSLMRFLTRFTLRRADLVTADARDVLEEASRIAGITLCTELVQWGVDTGTFNPLGRIASRSERQWSDEFIILSTRSLEDNYNVDTIIDAFCRIAPQIPEAVLIIVGEGPMRSVLTALAQSSGFADRIRFTGAVTYQEIVRLYQGADIFITVPSSDATSMSLLEAMACGLPVIVSDLPANRAWVTAGVGGVYARPRSSVDVADAIRTLHADRQLRARLSRSNRELVVRKADHHAEMERMMQLYRNTILKNDKR